MSAAEHQSSNLSQSAKLPIKKPLKRPSLRQPPSRSTDFSKGTPPAVSSEKRSVASPSSIKPSDTPAVIPPSSQPAVEVPQPTLEPHPISPPSEPMQYRAIGLVRGVYTPEAEDQLNRGSLMTDDGSEVDSVLLGRVTSLIKNHIDLQASHLWVVYPRTREADSEQNPGVTDLHLQIVGVWEPETLGMPGEGPKKAIAAGETPPDEAPRSLASAVADSALRPDADDAVPDLLETEADLEVSPEPAHLDHASPEPAHLDHASPAPAQAEAAVESGVPAEISATPDGPETEAADIDPAVAASTVVDDVSDSDHSADPGLAESQADAAISTPLPSENYFSIRGEVLKCSEDDQQILVKILQGAKRSDKSPKAFRIHVSGLITGRTVGYFWELEVERKGKQLTLVEGRTVGIVPPKKNKRKKGAPLKSKRQQFKKAGRPHKPGGIPQPKSKPRIRPSAPVKSNPL